MLYHSVTLGIYKKKKNVCLSLSVTGTAQLHVEKKKKARVFVKCCRGHIFVPTLTFQNKLETKTNPFQ